MDSWPTNECGFLSLNAAAQRSSLSTDRVEALVDQLVADLAASWRQGRRTPVEELLAKHSEVSSHPEAAVRLIYEEICLRYEIGQQPDSEEIRRRFPQFHEHVQLLLECLNVLEPQLTAPAFPEPGEMLGEFSLLAQLSQGAWGRVFLASQHPLADRPVVLKVTPADGSEHLALARLQHTHIVPLYLVQDFPNRHLQALCMPYLGGATLAQLLEILRPLPPGQRTGKELLDALDKLQASYSVQLPTQGPARQYLARASYSQALSWIGVCLADALQYAHERGLVHLDLKPGNVLLTADAQPMLLDFHLARAPIAGGTVALESIGGTPAYMSPEQESAWKAVREGQPIPQTVDHRSDIYSLGMLLYEALGGPIGVGLSPRRLPQFNPEVSVGLADILHKCLDANSHQRYADARALGADLRRHLQDLPLRGVRNRSLVESWRKWRRRRRHGLTLGMMLVLVLAAAFVVCGVTLIRVTERAGEAKEALATGQEHLQKNQYPEAVRSLSRGLARAKGLPGQADLIRSLENQLRLAHRAQAAHELHALTERLRFLYGIDSLSRKEVSDLEARSRAVWRERSRLLESQGLDLGSATEQRVRTDLLDLAILAADLRRKLGASEEVEKPRDHCLALLAEAEAALGSSLILNLERQSHEGKLDPAELAQAAAGRGPGTSPRTAWEHYALGRILLRAHHLPAAVAHFDRAIELEPASFWPHLFRGICTYRLGHYPDAVQAFRVCIALAPDRAACYYNRALAYTAMDRLDDARRDYDRTLQLDPQLAAAALNRGILQYRQKNFAGALSDLQRALENGSDPVIVNYNLALVFLAQHDRKAALTHLERALFHNPKHREAGELLERLR